ncbi:MAG: cob(I)yrinic acid a,c-diamide adenosyltransferase [Bacteroides sp.]|nr:cob(I)yrinic acid a,c-diamide adenosyltransferase [Bacteroides sp.]MCM1550215.1 cob(I)yrinic acid a,c-diamide adenosyltransferase [Clostridium sp.]
MSKVQVICGSGIGKTSAAVGYGIKRAGGGKEVIIVQFLKGSETEDYNLLSRLEPEIKLLSFERVGKCYDELTPEQQKEQKANIMNGFHYARKVIQTNECDILILDESLGLVDSGIIDVARITELLELAKESDMEILLTGRILPEEIQEASDIVTRIEAIK